MDRIERVKSCYHFKQFLDQVNFLLYISIVNVRHRMINIVSMVKDIPGMEWHVNNYNFLCMPVLHNSL